MYISVQGRPSPQWRISPHIRFPRLLRIFQSVGKFLSTFSKKCRPMFNPRKFWWPFLSHWLWVSNFPLKRYISPYFWKIIIYPTTFFKFPPDFLKCTRLACLTFFSFPPSLTMMHQTMHVLDAPVAVRIKSLPSTGHCLCLCSSWKYIGLLT